MAGSIEIYDSWRSQFRNKRQGGKGHTVRQSLRVAIIPDWMVSSRGIIRLKQIFSADLGDFDGEPSLFLEAIGVHQHEGKE